MTPRRPSILLHLATAAVWLLAGCGGGNGPADTNLKLGLNWAAQSRDVSTPSSAVVCEISLYDPANPDGPALHTWDIPRGANPAAYHQDWLSPDKIPVRQWYMKVQFFGVAAKPANSLVARGVHTFQMNGDGTGPGTVAVTGLISTVEIPTGEGLTVFMGTPAYLPWECKAADGSLIATPHDAVFWNVVTGTDVLSFTADGMAQGLKPGTATVTATVDGKVSAAVTVTVQPAPTTVTVSGGPTLLWLTTPAGERIIFAAKTTGFYGVYAVKPDGTGLQRVADVGADLQSFDINSTLTAGVGEIGPDYWSCRTYAVSAATGWAPTAITPTGFRSGSPVFNKDGTKVLFSRAPANTPPVLMTTNLDGSNPQQVGTQNGLDNGHYSPDGTKIIAGQGFNGDGVLALMNSDGTNFQTITGPAAYARWDGRPVFSPDGTKIAYISCRRTGDGAKAEVAIIGAGPGNTPSYVIQVTGGETNNAVCFSPDGTKIAYTSTKVGGVNQVFTANVNGTSVVQLTH